MSDVWTVVRKEWREYLAQDNSRLATTAGLIVALLFLGVGLPFFAGRDWADGSVGSSLYLPLFFVVSLVADSFAGERERHTLETLLASRLSDRAILLGKAGAALLATWAFVAAVLLLGLTTVNLRDGWHDGPVVPSAAWWASLGLGLLGSLFVAGIGVLISMRVPTVRQAQQLTMLLVFGLFLLGGLLLLGGFLGWRLVPAGVRDAIGDIATGPGEPILVVLAGLAPLAIALAPLALALKRFRRPRLLLG